MFRVTSCLTVARTLFYRRYPVDFRVATITRFPTKYKYNQSFKERETCPVPPPPPPPPPKDDSLFWGTIALLFLAGGFVVYAKGSPEVRDWLTINAPWFDDLIAILYQENMTYGEFAVTCVDGTKRFLERLAGTNKPKKCSLDGGEVLNYDVPEECKDVKDPDDTEVCEPEPPPVITRDICEIERCMVDLGETVINNYNTAKEACACYNSLIENTMTTFTFKGMKDLRPAMEERIELVNNSLHKASCAITRLDEMVKYLDCGVQASKDQIKNSKLLARDYHEKFKAAFMAYQWENDRSIALDAQWQLVEQSVEKYTWENEAIFPELKYIHKKPTLSGDMDILLYNTYRYIQQLTDQVKDTNEGMTERINRAMDTLSQEPEKVKAREANVQNAVKSKKADVDKDFKSREDQQKADNDKYLKDSLTKQTKRHDESLAKRLAQLEADINSKFQGMVADKVAAEKKIFKVELDAMAQQLKLVEDKLEARLKAEREARRSQELWSAGASLLAATKKGEPYVRVDKELRAIEKASGDGDKLVTTVLKSIPKSVREVGIVPESVLREAFNVMEKTARSVALVEAEGASMPVYMLSWLQGLMLFMKISGIPQAEFDQPPEEPNDQLDTFDLLQRARFWLDHGNLAAAVRHVDSLKGASRAAADKWFEAARAHLEVRQAAEAVLAHAAAMALQYI
ncbi:MICOS complex subunit Mic60-like isoform X1 [Spodoptera litura]|uniref:MICOS complex subunit MIC60 n=1 Tax=Spodoptera litura TaxID=69820 RepID=A0A9J7EF89_SPOLT|nr:MICOS complex subunit Mic60-like isoform X1 [Spodoptera litura]